MKKAHVEALQRTGRLGHLPRPANTCTMLLLEQYAMPGIYNTPLEQVIMEALVKWRKIPLLERNRPLALTSCAQCRYQGHCGAGCMGRAALSCKALMAPEDRCALRKAVYHLDEKPGKARSLQKSTSACKAPVLPCLNKTLDIGLVLF